MHGEMHGKMHDFGYFGGHMGPGMRGRGMFGGLRGLILSHLEKKPMKGLELIQAVETVTMGMWKPSPGSVYPLLSSMEDEGLIKRLEDGKYELTQEGRNQLDERRSIMEGFSPFSSRMTPEKMISEMDAYLTYFEDMGQDTEKYSEGLKKLAEKLSKLLSQN